MKKILVPLLLSLGTYASAAFLPSTSTFVNQGYPGTVDWPVKVATITVNNLYSGSTNYTVNPTTATQGTAGTSGWMIDATTGIYVTTGGGKNLGVNFTTAVLVNVTNLAAGSTVYVVNPTTSTQGPGGTSGWKVDATTGIYVTTGGGKYLSIETTTGAYVVGGAANGASIVGNPLAPGVDVASSSIPSGVANGKIAYQMGNPYGQISVTGMPYGVTFSTFMLQISSSIYGLKDQKDAVLVSSAGANLRTYICGCVFTNTTATNGEVILASPVNATGESKSNDVTTAESHYMPWPVPANYIPSGWMGSPTCSSIWFSSALNSSISIIQNVASSVQNVRARCNYFQAQ